MGEKINIWRGLAFSRGFLWKDFLNTDLTALITTLDLPLYLFTGIYDFTANHALARNYFDLIKAPVKGFYTFETFAHSPLFEQPLRARDILAQDVLTHSHRLADQ